MMRCLYNMAMLGYQFCIRTASRFGHTKARLMNDGWKTVWQKLEDAGMSETENVWFHASSLGEFEQARPVIELLKKNHPEYKVIVTFFSPSGYEVRKHYDLADLVCYLPIDTLRNARRFVQLVKPKKVYFVKYDFWFNYMKEIKGCGAELYIFSTIFRSNQYFFKWYGRWFLQQLHQFDHLYVQNQESVNLLCHHGITCCTIAGDTRFDRVKDITMAAKRFPQIEAFIGNTPVLMAGSSWEPDEANIKGFVDNYSGDLKLIIAPHMIHEEHLAKIETLFGSENCVRYTSLSQNDNGKRVLIIDTMGMLAAMYRYATVAYIGGGFGQGIHNILEAVTFGKPVVFGPRYQKFKEAHDIISLGGGFNYEAAEELMTIMKSLLEDSTHYQQASEVCAQYVNSNIGATSIILENQ